MSIPIYFQTQFTDAEGASVHSDGCCPIEYVSLEGGKPVSFREFTHKLLDEWLDNFEESGQETTANILDGAHIIFAPCSLHKHDDED